MTLFSICSPTLGIIRFLKLLLSLYFSLLFYKIKVILFHIFGGYKFSFLKYCSLVVPIFSYGAVGILYTPSILIIVYLANVLISACCFSFNFAHCASCHLLLKKFSFWQISQLFVLLIITKFLVIFSFFNYFVLWSELFKKSFPAPTYSLRISFNPLYVRFSSSIYLKFIFLYNMRQVLTAFYFPT